MKAVVLTLGCKVNQCESEYLLYQLKERGYEVSESLEPANLYIINTCAVTKEAEKKSRQAVAKINKINDSAKIIVTGCASQNNPQAFITKNNVTLVYGARNKTDIINQLDKQGIIINDSDCFIEQNLKSLNLKTRAYLKIQDGCDNFCSYCIVPHMRGKSRSKSIESVINELNQINAKEVVLTGINLSAYNAGGKDLTQLIKALKYTDKRIRLGSLENNIINHEFLTALKTLQNFAPHFHLSLQSGSDSVLNRMNRHYTAAEFLQKVDLIRKYFDNPSIMSDIILCYPTETGDDFKQTLNLCQEARLSDIHVFVYSKRPKTKAEALKELSEDIKAERLKKALKLKEKLYNDFLESFKGKRQTVLIEERVSFKAASGGVESQRQYYAGYTENYIRVYLNSCQPSVISCQNEFAGVILKERFKDGFLAVSLPCAR